MTVKKLVIAAEVFSKNTGDQVIYQCLRHMFLQLSPSLTVKPLDISGRSPDMRMDYMVQFGGLPSRLGYLAAHIMGSLVNYSLYRIYKNYPKHLNAWRPVLHNVDRVLIGGGQLFMDNRLDFPIKLFSLSRELTSRKIPYYIGACGVGEHWSSLG